MTIKTGCQCFSCRHSDDLRLVKAYCVGFKEASEQFLNWAKKTGLKKGSITGDDINDLYMQISCNFEDTLCYMDGLPDIED